MFKRRNKNEGANENEQEKIIFTKTDEDRPDSEPEYSGDEDTDKALAKAKRKKRKLALKLFKTTVWLLVLSVIVYMAVNIVTLSMPDMQFQVAIQDTIVDYMAVDGFVDLKTTPVSGSGGYLYFTVTNGQRVSEGQKIAETYGTAKEVENKGILEKINNEINLLDSVTKMQAELGDAQIYSRQMQTSLYGILASIQNKDYSDMQASRDELQLASNKMQMATDAQIDLETRFNSLAAQKQMYENTHVPLGEINAPITGYFVQSPKNDIIPTESEIIKEATAEELNKLLNNKPEYYGEDIIGHIVSDYKWSFYTVVSSMDVDKFPKGEKLELTFPDAGGKIMPVVVKNIELETGDKYAKIELYCEYIGPEILNLRAETAWVIFDQQTGLRVDKEALRLVNGVKGVYVKFGNTVRFKRINVLLEDENYILVQSQYEKNVSELEMYDEIIVRSGGEELYDGKKL